MNKLMFVIIICIFPKFLLANSMIQKALISDTIDVIHYDINLDVGFKSNGQIYGYTDIKIKSLRNNVNNLNFELLLLSVDSVKVNYILNNFSYISNLIRIPLQNYINSGDSLNVQIYYHGVPHVESYGWGGFHISSGISYNLGISFADDPHNYGKCFFPCIDDFIDRALYDLHVTVDSNKFAVCGGSLINDINNGDGSRTIHWKLHNTIPAYLASVAIYNYVGVSGHFNGINGNIPTYIYVQPNDTTKAKASFTYLNKILQAFEYYWGPYRWEKVGYVATTLGAMEHATNIAYPVASIDGTLNNETITAHELSHHWFGNLITCSSANDMWINEGWATFNEALYKEWVYGKKEYKDYLRTKLKRVLQFCHIEDNGYRALYGIPSNYTYGETVYQKGSTVVQTLRGYLGDSLFFNSVKAMLDQFSFNHISTTQMCNFLSNYTGINLTDFFNFYVYNPGFTHFSIDSVINFPQTSNYKVYIRQRIKQAPYFADKNIVEITFMDNQWHKYTDTIHFSGEFGYKTFALMFTPSTVMVDLNEKLADATTDKYEVINNTGTFEYNECFAQLEAVHVIDSALVRIVHNWIKPDNLKLNNNDIKRIHSERYWNIEGVLPDNFINNIKFYYNRQPSENLDYKFLPSPQSVDSMVLLYRKNSADEWHLINFIRNGDYYSGYLITQQAQQGEYVLAISKPNQSKINLYQPLYNKQIEIFPNPSNNSFIIKINEKYLGFDAFIYNSNGKLIDKFALKNESFYWEPKQNESDIFFIKIYDKEKKIIENEKFIYEK